MADPMPSSPAPRRSRRSNIGVKHEAPEAAQIHTPARTPRRGTKRVRFSDPGPCFTHGNDELSSSSGLTPMIRRTSLLTPRRRRTSTPIRPFKAGSATNSDRSTTSAQDGVVDGRVQRRIRRSNVRDLVNKLDLEKKRTTSQVTALRKELRDRDREIHELQNATIVVDTERIWDLERQVANLKEEVDRHARDDVTELNDDRSFNWTMAARDPFDHDFMDMDDEEEGEDSHFSNATMGQIVCSTPSKAQSSFPTPPATSPLMPATPTSRFERPLPTPQSHVGVQVTFDDPQNKYLQEELASLQLELSKLSHTLESYEAFRGRLEVQLAAASPCQPNGEPDSTLESLEVRVKVLMQSVSDQSAATQHLASSIGELGFPGSDASDMLTSLSKHFRAARLELEYLTPGEIALPLTSHGAEVLDLLLARLRELATRVKEGEDSIDEYHEIELSLRKQLDARVTVMDGLKVEMGKAQKLMADRDARIRELEIGNDRLKGAVSGYVRDISELEKLVEGLEQQAQDVAATHATQEESSRQTLTSRDDLIENLEVKLSAAARRAESLQQQLTEASSTHSRHITSLNKQHGAALALRDARVTELRSEIDRVNESIRAAHETIRGLRVENGGLERKMEDERMRAKAALDAMKDELQRVLEMSQDFLNTPQKSKQSHENSAEQPGAVSASPLAIGKRRSSGGLLSGELARRGSKNSRRRYDSGVGFMDGEEADD